MDIWKVVRTVLEKIPGLRAKDLMSQLKNKSGLSRSTLYEHLGSLENQKKINREKGHYWLSEPEHYSDLGMDLEDAFRKLVAKDYGQVDLELVASIAGRPITPEFEKIAFKLAKRHKLVIGKEPQIRAVEPNFADDMARRDEMATPKSECERCGKFCDSTELTKGKLLCPACQEKGKRAQ